eukprot:scaffold4730_cov109-Isochrysis_galbana.AAC.5
MAAMANSYRLWTAWPETRLLQSAAGRRASSPPHPAPLSTPPALSFRSSCPAKRSCAKLPEPESRYPKHTPPYSQGHL